MNYRKLTILTVVVFLATTVHAKVKLPHILSSGMVVQQQSKIRLWGWSKPHATIKVNVSWSMQGKTCTANQQGEWSIMVKTPQAGYTPLSITFDDGEPLTLSNILSGEVWVCAGQSNMEMPLRGFDECPVEGYLEAIKNANRTPGIRYLKVPVRMSARPLDDASCRWVEADIRGADNCSAVGYFFARTLRECLNIPIGLILANKGGTRVESWLNETNLRQYTNDPTDSLLIVKKFPQEWLCSMLWGNGTFHPIQKYTVKGILFYQGCSNVGNESEQYARRLEVLVNQWREAFAQPLLPFYFVQIAPYLYGNALATDAAYLREQQMIAAANIKNSSLVCTNDLVYPQEENQIHPSQKQQIGERLAFTALARDYGYDNIMYKSPSLGELTIQNDTCIVRLKDTYHGVKQQKEYTGFDIAGEDKIYYPAKATYKGNDIFILSSPQVLHPKAVRYCYRNFQLGNVANMAGLPLFPFSMNSNAAP